MKKSPVHPGCSLGDSNGYAVDPWEDFSLFLEEAKRHARATNNVHFPSPYPEAASDKNVGEGKKSKKSWKSSLLFWWKTSQKKNKQVEESVHRSHVAKPKRRNVSGPILWSKARVDVKLRRCPTSSGPIKSFFSPIKKVENDDMAYVCLDKFSCSRGVQNYGHVYSVS